MLEDLRARAPELLADIREKREVTKETEDKLTKFLDNFAKTFA